MEKEQIVKALEVCANYQKFSDCDKCPAREGCDNENNFLEKEALSLIREQDKRIEKLERICDSYAMQCGTATDKEVFLQKERADTVRKMRERLYPLYELLCVDEGDWRHEINKIANKLLEENT